MIARDRVIEEPHPLQVEQQGYAIIPGALGPDEIQEMVVALERSPLQRSRAGIRHLLSNPTVSELATDARLLGVAQAVLGADAFPFRATLFDKNPDSNWLIPWHQDTALPLHEKHETPGWGSWSVKDGVIYAHAPAMVLEQVVALRMHLDDSTAENGPLRVVPGTHRQGVLTDQEVEAIVAEGNIETCLSLAGGVIVMRPLIIHASSKSQSSVPRRVLHIEYATPSAVPMPLQLAVA